MLTTAAGFLIASTGHVDFGLLLATLGGISLVIGSACVFNNYIDRDIDKKMTRTQNRALASGELTAQTALPYALVLGLAGFSLMVVFVNWRAAAVSAAAFIIYVIVYGIAKRRSIHGTLVGTLAGASPPAIGYLAVTNHVDAAATLLFLILVFWQMTHFYAIAIYRLKDYKAAGLPVWPAKKGLTSTQIQMTAYLAAFIIAAASLTAFEYTGFIYLFVVTVLGLAWLRLDLQGFKAKDVKRWARQMFRFSLIVMAALSAAISVGARLP